MSDERFAPLDPDKQRLLRDWEEQGRVEGKPGVALDFAVTWCPTHLAPYRARWPEGAGLAMIELFQAAAADTRLQEMAGGDVEQLGRVVLECSPLCCFLGDDIVNAIVARTAPKLT